MTAKSRKRKRQGDTQTPRVSPPPPQRNLGKPAFDKMINDYHEATKDVDKK